ncbi:hypothetical protein EIK77_000414 [Talaromyces pinophilus]|nr:hypothetical protein EIK77_000414 [Talaromyces pinophilus]
MASRLNVSSISHFYCLGLKLINAWLAHYSEEALLLLDDYYSDDSDNCWFLATSKNLPEGLPGITEPEFDKIPENDFAGKSVEEVHECLLKQHDSRRDVNISWIEAVILDPKGFQTDTVSVTNRDMADEESSDYEEGDDIWTNTFKTTRVPCEEVWNVMINLGLANFGFEGLIDEKAGPQDDGTWKYHSTSLDDPEERDRMRRRIEKRLTEMKQLGYVSADTVPRLGEARL